MSTSVDPARCPLCGGSNACQMVAGSGECWCLSVQIPKERLDAIPEAARGVACLCRTCATSERMPADTLRSEDGRGDPGVVRLRR